MLLSCSVQNWIDATTIAANIATFIGAISIFAAACLFFKNRVNKKHVKFILKEIMEKSEEDSKLFLRIENYTDKNFYITQIVLNNKNRAYSAKEIYQCQPKIYNLTDLEPISISAFECLNISPVFEIKKSQIDKNAKLIIQTTAGPKITLSVFRLLKLKKTSNSSTD